MLISTAFMGSKYLSGNNLPRISLIRGKLCPDRYLHPIPACLVQLRLLLSLALVVLWYPYVCRTALMLSLNFSLPVIRSIEFSPEWKPEALFFCKYLKNIINKFFLYLVRSLELKDRLHFLCHNL